MFHCSRCLHYLSPGKSLVDEKEKDVACSICLGGWSDELPPQLKQALMDSSAPYGPLSDNNISFRISPPTIALPGDIVYRYTRAAQRGSTGSSKPVGQFVNDLKAHAHKLLREYLREEQGPETLLNDYPSCINNEEQGFLCFHVLAIPTKTLARPAHSIVQSTKRKGKKRKLDEESQGGDPRANLTSRLGRENTCVWTLNQAIESSLLSNVAFDDGLISEETPSSALEFHVAVWRRSFYLRGMYTKSRRDVSQTPFYVVKEGKRKRLGVTSVEDEIVPVLTRHSGGISSLNNDPELDKVVFGMAKFHASGREDMDVRMLLPERQVVGQKVTGRPFVIDLVDAFRLPPVRALQEMVREINKEENDDEVNVTDTAEVSSTTPRMYGKNPMGVGISSDFQFVPSSSFKNLQAETEEKVKHYGCLCWSKSVLPASSEELTNRLGQFPVELKQRTPIRVLHRRANTVRIRHVLTLRAHRIDDHYFRLNISTDAGTYVKEFVHSDLGRTEPSIASLLGCQTDILELDCEGIQFN